MVGSVASLGVLLELGISAWSRSRTRPTTDPWRRAGRPQPSRAATADFEGDADERLPAALARAFEPFFMAAEEGLVDLDLFEQQTSLGGDSLAAAR